MARTASRRSLTDRELDELLDHIEDRLHLEPCDTTLRHTNEFLASRAFDLRAITAWLNHRGGYCDCEVLMNVGGW